MSKDKSYSGIGEKVIKKLTLPDGFRVGIVDLDITLKEVADLKIVEAKSIKEELLKRVETKNYIPSDARNDYSTALFQEFQNKYGYPRVSHSDIQAQLRKHTKG